MRLLPQLLSQVTKRSVSNKSYITTPIYYVNASPHIGHLYSSVIADAAARWRRLYDPSIILKFCTGTDEHGMKIQRAALENKVPVLNYCNMVSEKYKELSQMFGVEYTDFVRTSEARHKLAVEEFWKTIKDNGYIYSAKYSGWYCVSDETFLSDSQLKEIVVNGNKLFVSAESGHPVEWAEEENYMFKLQHFRDDLKHWLQKDGVVKPKKFQKILLNLLEDDLPDLSVSRPINRVAWGIKVPDDDKQTVYVWLDALVNYLTVCGYPNENYKSFWPPDLQVIGKDILKFHGVYWPAFLMAANMEPPKTLFCHSHWTVDDQKMSKSRGNVVCPKELSNIYTPEGVRYFLLREGVAHNDGNYSDIKLKRILNSELADTLGNLLSRCCGIALNPDQVFPEAPPEARRTISCMDVTERLIESLNELPGIAEGHYKEHNFYKVADSTLSTLYAANLFFETLKPWELKQDKESLHCVLYFAMETLRVSAIVLSPLLPELTRNLLNKLSVGETQRSWSDVRPFAEFKTRRLSGDKLILFRRILDEKRIRGMK